MNSWISIKDELPSIGIRVMVFDKNGFGVLSGRLGSAGWYLENELDKNCNVTHWMYLPSPPEGEINND